KECVDNINKTFEVQFKNKDIDFIVVTDDRLEAVNIISDEVKLSQIINNLLSNALKFTRVGSVSFLVKVEKITETTTTILFEVTDTGIGIPKNKQAEIFQGFAQVHVEEIGRSYGGTGLGLTISERLVNKFGGLLEVESDIGEGSRFYFNILFDNALKAPVKVKVEN